MPSRKKIRVLVVEDSLVVRELLCHIIGQDDRLELAAAVASAEEALDILEKVKPDVISLDIRLPGMNGLQATLEIMATRPTPIVVVAADVDGDELNIAMNALKAGALTVVEKPVGVTNEAYQEMAENLCRQIVIMSDVRVLKQARRRGFNFAPSSLPEADDVYEKPSHAPKAPLRNKGAPVILGIAASTGGPSAVSQLLTGLGRNFPLPVLLIQHMTDSFLPGFVSWLGETTPFRSCFAQENEKPLPGSLYLPPANTHLVVRGGLLALNRGPLVSGQRPSATVLFNSMAADYGSHAIGVVLTGMGDDGAEGLLAMRRAGAYTLAEDHSTAVVYGMPQAAEKLGAVRSLLPLDVIAARIHDLIKEPSAGARS
ncbi:MAG: chemotaxis-specific protein-glutamate methyltransferase CheB [Alphaproteobacteria bacterium]|nr:chemotaxis-specific protein-glutamate methyltransferase CheB [Alphaproteobacteria bacterium]